MRQKLVVKYKNRKLYDSEQHTYISLAHLVEFVKRDIAFKVMEKETRKDVTESSLREALVYVDVPTTTLIKLLKDNKENY